MNTTTSIEVLGLRSTRRCSVDPTHLLFGSHTNQYVRIKEGLCGTCGSTIVEEYLLLVSKDVFVEIQEDTANE